MRASEGVGARGRSGGPGAEGRRILIVDDSPTARKLLQQILLRLGVALPELRIASTAREAQQLFAQWNPHVVFLDLELRPPVDQVPPVSGEPDGVVSGADLARRFLERNPEVRVIVCSASDPVESPLGPLVRAGKIESMVKPLVAARVLEVLGRVGVTPIRPTGRN